MFNHFFYTAGGFEACKQFLEAAPRSSLAIIVDPPFGGLAEVLAVSIRKCWEMAGGGMYEGVLLFCCVNRVIIFHRGGHFSCVSILFGGTCCFSSSISLDDGLPGM